MALFSQQNQSPQLILNELKYQRIFSEVFLDWNSNKSDFNIAECLMLQSNK